VISILVWCM